MESFWDLFLRQTGVGKNLAQDFVDLGYRKVDYAALAAVQ